MSEEFDLTRASKAQRERNADKKYDMQTKERRRTRIREADDGKKEEQTERKRELITC